MKYLTLILISLILVGCKLDSKDKSNDLVNQNNPDTIDESNELVDQNNPDTICVDNIIFQDSTTVQVQVNKEFDICLVEPSKYHGDEIDSTLIDYSWFGLFELENNQFELKSVNIDIKLVFDAIVDREGEMSGKKIIVDATQKPLFLIGGNINLKEGIIKGKKYKSLEPMDTITLDSKHFIFATGCYTKIHNNREEIIFNYQIIASNGFKSQIINNDLRFVPGEGPRIVWSGYLDNDTIPDFIYNMRTHYNVTEFMLFLSSKADNKDIYKLVAIRRSVGC